MLIDKVIFLFTNWSGISTKWLNVIFKEVITLFDILTKWLKSIFDEVVAISTKWLNGIFYEVSFDKVIAISTKWLNGIFNCVFNEVIFDEVVNKWTI